MPLEIWAEFQPPVRDSLVANEASTRRACQAADAADAAAEQARKDTALRVKVEAASATDDECRSACRVCQGPGRPPPQATRRCGACQGGRLLRPGEIPQSQGGRRPRGAGAYALHYAHHTASASLARHPGLPFQIHVNIIRLYLRASADSTIVRHTQTAFRPEDANVVYSAECFLSAFMEAFPMGTLDMVLASPETSSPTATINTACDLLFALRKAHKNAQSTPYWPDGALPATDPALNRKRGSRSVDSKDRRDHGGGASSSRGSSWRSASSPTGPKSRKLGKGPRQRSSSAKAAANDTNSDVAQLKTPRQVVHCLLGVSSGGGLHQLSRSEPATDDRALPLSPTTAHVRQAAVTAIAAESDAAHDAAVKRADANINVHKIEGFTPMPFHASLDKTDAAHRLTRSVNSQRQAY